MFLAVGLLRRSHGLKGDMVMEVLTGFPERLRAGRTVFVGETHEPMQIASLRGHEQGRIIGFAGIQTPEETAPLRNQLVFIKAAGLPQLPEGEYYHHELLGLSVVDESGSPLGVLAQILETGANDVYLVKTPAGKELLFPAIEDVILEVNLERRQMRVRPLDWF